MIKWFAIALLGTLSTDGAVKTVKDTRPAFQHERSSLLYCLGENEEKHVCGWQVVNTEDPAIKDYDTLQQQRNGGAH